jgi:alpha-1,2-mannosyltransferase
VLSETSARPISALFALPIFAVAVAARLAPVLRGGGLFSDGNYDDAVHYAAAAGLVHGRMPYEDFLFLHPPGIALALAPFAALGTWTSDALGMAAARLAWILLGGINAALVVLILRKAGLTAAIGGGLFYAGYLPAIYSEHTTLLEALGTAGILLSLLIGRFAYPAASSSTVRVLTAGLVAGAAASVKVWGVVPVLVLVVWVLSQAGWRRALRFLAASVAGCSLVCLPFFVNAPRAMWEMVVLDQLGRPANPSLELRRKLYDLLGLRWEPLHVGWLLVVVLLVGILLIVAAWTTQDGRIFVLLLAAGLAVLTLTPVWWIHYASFIAGPAALTVGAGISQISRWVEVLGNGPRYAVVSLFAICGMVIYGGQLLNTRLQSPFPGKTLSASVTAADGCITSDQPIALIETDVLTRNLQRGCRHMVDIRGYAHHRSSSAWAPEGRTRSRGWQAHTLEYCSSGELFISAHFSATRGFDKATAATVQSWPVVAKAGRYVVRDPHP